MKILHIMGGAKAGGAELAFFEMAVAMHEAGQDVAVIVRKKSTYYKALVDAGVKVYTARFGAAADLQTKAKIKKIISEFEPDIVQTWMARAASKTPNWEKNKTKKRYYTFARLGGYYDLKYFKAMDYFVAATPDLKSHIERSGVNPSTVRQINNFTEIDNEAVAIKRKEFDTPDEATVIVSLARYHPVKALDILVDAMKDLPDCYLWLAGDGPLRKDLEAQAKDLGVEERIKFLGWREDRDELLRAADICAFVSRHEGFGNVFVQAWGNKVPVIVSDAQGPRQFCTHEEDCLMVPKDNSAAIAESVKRLQSDKVLAMKIVNEGHQNYQENFTKEKSVENYLQFYKDVLSAPQGMHVENQNTNQKKSIQLM